MRGKLVHLKAHALSLKPGAKGDEIKVKGQVIAENADVPDYDFAAPTSVIGLIEVGGKLVPPSGPGLRDQRRTQTSFGLESRVL